MNAKPTYHFTSEQYAVALEIRRNVFPEDPNYESCSDAAERICSLANAERDALKNVIRSLLIALPVKRDWLDPQVEKAAHNAVK